MNAHVWPGQHKGRKQSGLLGTGDGGGGGMGECWEMGRLWSHGHMRPLSHEHEGQPEHKHSTGQRLNSTAPQMASWHVTTIMVGRLGGVEGREERKCV